MKIAQVAPLYESVPPQLYGGTERVVSYLTEELVGLGHDVTLFASADSRTAARLEPQSPRALRLDHECVDPIPEHVRMLDDVFRRAGDFDVLHFHTDYLHFPLAVRSSVPHVTTLHGRLDLPHLASLYRAFRAIPFISISDAQRAPMPWLDWQRTVHHGLPLDLYDCVDDPDDYLAFVGRVSPEKRLDRAIEIARRAGMELRVAAKIDRRDRDYFDQQIRPLFRDPTVRYVGEVGEADKRALLGHARALLFPIDWPEPFGLVMIEAMACGTPVIAYPGGAVAEVLEDGCTGYLVHSIEDAVRAVQRLDALDRRRCREVFEARFSARRMATDYLATYVHLLERPDAIDPEAAGRGVRPLLRPSAVGPAG